MISDNNQNDKLTCDVQKRGIFNTASIHEKENKTITHNIECSNMYKYKNAITFWKFFLNLDFWHHLIFKIFKFVTYIRADVFVSDHPLEVIVFENTVGDTQTGIMDIRKCQSLTHTLRFVLTLQRRVLPLPETVGELLQAVRVQVV